MFPIASVVREEKAPAKEMDVRTALTEAMTQMYTMNHDKHVDYVLERLKPYLKNPPQK